MQLSIVILCILPFLGFITLLVAKFYLEYVLEDLRLDNNPFKENENFFYPGKERNVARYYIDKNIESKNRIQRFIYIENTGYGLFVMFFILLCCLPIILN